MRNTSIERRKSQLCSVAQDPRGENPTATDKSPESHRASPRKQNAELWSRERREKARVFHSDSRPLHDPDSASAVSSHTISITVSHDSSDHHLHVPHHATFGDLKKAFVLETGLEASDMKILFWGDEKDDAEQLQAAGVTDGSSVFLVEEPNNGVDHVEPPPVMTEEIAKAISAVLAVSGEVDELSDRVGALEAAVDGGTIVAVKEFDMAAELLMRQLLKLDGIKADGEARVQRKAEVRRIQKLQEDVDTLKARCYRAKPQL